MSTELARTNGNAQDGSIIEAVIAKGDLGKLSPDERLSYYNAVCRSVGVNPLTRPFDYMNLQGKITLYARKDATDQLRKINKVSVHDPQITYGDGLVTVLIHATTPDGRTDFDIGAVNVEGLKGESRANAVMKAITKAKRRVTLSIVGLGWLDETEIDGIAQRVVVDDTGEIRNRLPAPAPAPAPVTTPDPAPFIKPADALAWAVDRGLPEEEARALLTKCRDDNGGKLNAKTAFAIYEAFSAAVESWQAPEVDFSATGELEAYK